MWSSDSSSENDEEIIELRIRRRRNFKPRINFMMPTVYEYNERFRMSAEKIQELCESIGHILQHETHRNYALNPVQQIQTALHWLGTGSQYHAVTDMHGISKATVCRIIHKTVRAINMVLLQQVIRFPEGDDMLQVVRNFHALAGMPTVFGVVDGSLINIDAPNENEEAFVDRYGNHSINLMAVCGPDSKFYYVNANWPGSVHDARVLRTSNLCHRMDEGWRPIPNGIILGDSAYPVKHWLIPPIIRHPEDIAEQRFLRSHKSTRQVIEQAFGILKEKFPCLNHLRLNPRLASEVILACTVLCNISRNQNDNNDIDFRNNEEEENNPLDEDGLKIIGNVNRLEEIINHFR